MQRIVMCITLCIIPALSGSDLITKDARYGETVPLDVKAIEGYPIPYSGCRQSPGITVGVTDYDGRLVGCYTTPTSSGGCNFVWTYRFDDHNANRRVYYNFFYPPSYWLGAGPMTTQPSIACGLDHMGDGRALISLVESFSGSWWPMVYTDAAEGAGTFTAHNLPVPNPLDPILWPLPCVDAGDNIHISGTSNTGLHIIRSTDEGDTWSDWLLVDASGDHECWATYTGKTAIVYSADADFENVYYWETTDNGVNWTPDTVFIPPPQDSVVGYIWNSAVYDNNGYLHAVFNCIDPSPAGQGGQNSSGCRSQIRHWNQETGQISIVASGWWTLDPGPGSFHPTVSECQIAIDRVSGTLYCTWCQADPGDVAANGYTNLEIYGAYSTDNGTAWSTAVNITNSQTPGASTGYCDHDWWQSLARTVRNDTIYLFYMNDKDAGCSVLSEGLPTDNPMLFYRYAFSTGIEEQNAKTPPNFLLNITPNPTAHGTNISYALHKPSNVSLKLHSIDGRLVKTIPTCYREAGSHTHYLDLSALANGTYFVIITTDESKLSCPVIVVH